MIELLLEAERALSMGRADRAQQLYDQVVASDPRNSIAVVGLARVALERADDAGALVLARRALTIDPENDAARRLVQRLEEVLLARGEALPVEAAVIAPPLAEPTGIAPPAVEPAPVAPQAAEAAVIAPPAVEPPVIPPPVAGKATPFDGPDPVLGAAPVEARRDPLPADPQPSVEPKERRSLLDRLRRR